MYNAEILPENFDEPVKVRDKVNSFISNRTRGMIPEIIHEGPGPDIFMTLLNAINFKGKWNESFDAKKTKKRPFKNADETASIVPMMNKGSRHDSVRLPYYMAEDHKVFIKTLSIS